VSAGDNKPDAQRKKAYQLAAADAQDTVARFEKEIKDAQCEVAKQRKAVYNALETDEKKIAWLLELAGSRDGQQIIDDMAALLGGRAKTSQDKKFIDASRLIKAEQTLINERAYYSGGEYRYKKIRGNSAKLDELSQYADSEHNGENVAFLRAVDAGADYNHLAQEYINDNAPRWINLPSNIRNDLRGSKLALDEAIRNNLSSGVRGERERELRSHLSRAVLNIENLVSFDTMRRLAGRKLEEYDDRIAAIQQKLRELQAHAAKA